MSSMDDEDKRPESRELFAHLKKNLPALTKLLEDVDGRWSGEDGIYRFYHQSFKVYYLQDWTKKIVDALQALAPNRALNRWFSQIVREGTGKEFTLSHNQRWLEETRPIVEAFSHARYFLTMAVKYGAELERPPASLPSGWAAFLYLYDLR